MYTSEQIDSIMQELDLSPTDASARKVVEQLANSKPSALIDENFIANLREDLKKRSVAISNTAPETKSINFISMFMNKTLAAALVVAVVVIAGGAWYMQHNNQPLFHFQDSNGTDQLLSGKYDVKSVPEESFGDLNKVAIVPAADVAKLNSSNNGSSSTSAVGQASGMGGSPEGMSIDPAMPTDKMIAPGEPYPGAVYYTYKYDGANLNGLSAQQPVLKRSKPEQPATLVDRVLNMLSFGLIDLHTLKDVKLQNFSFIEDHQYGYGVYVDMQYGMVNIYQNYEQWPQPQYNCVVAACNTIPAKITLKDVPSNEDAIAAADAFLNDYKISKDGYGTPRVIDQQWRIAYDALSATEKSNFYIPDQVQVVYPLTLEGKEVYDESGGLYGLSVMVDTRTKRVTNVSELTSKQYEKSDYKGETDSKRIIDIAEQGGFRNSVYVDPNAKKVELQLGTPSLQMIKIYYSSDNYRTNTELYMPAMVFPIKNWKENNFWRQNVIVPLVKSILDTEQVVPQPIPLDTPATEPFKTPVSEQYINRAN